MPAGPLPHEFVFLGVEAIEDIQVSNSHFLAVNIQYLPQIRPTQTRREERFVRAGFRN
jgi:hypothetical protein